MKTVMKPTKMGLRVRWAAAALAAAAVLVLIGPWRWPLPLRSRWTLKAELPFMFSAYTDDRETRVRVSHDAREQSVELPLAVQNFQRLRFKWGSEIQKIELRRLEIESLFWDRAVAGRELARFFTADGTLGMRPGGGNSLLLDIRGETPVLVASPQLVRMIGTRLPERLAVTFLVWTGLLVLFLVLFSFSWRDGWGALKKKNIVPVLTAVLLLLFLAVALRVRWPGRLIDERRVLASKPEFRLDEWPEWGGQTERYLADHQGLRSPLVRLFNRICVDLLGSAPGENVLLGRRDWLFMGREREDLDARRGYRGLDPFDRQEAAAWGSMLAGRRKWLAERGIAYRFLVAPNKASIYPEHLPAGYGKKGHPSRLDQLKANLVDPGETLLVDLRQALAAARGGEAPVYHRTDSHWSPYGAWVACETLVQGLDSSIPLVPREAYDLFVGPRFGGDLAIALGLEMSRFRDTEWVRMGRKESRVSWEKLPDLGPYIRCQRSRNPDAPGGRLLLVHDSFAHELAPFLAEQFRELYLIWDWGLGFYPQIIEEFRPDVVIDEMAERYLYGPVPKNPF